MTLDLNLCSAYERPAEFAPLAPPVRLQRLYLQYPVKAKHVAELCRFTQLQSLGFDIDSDSESDEELDEDVSLEATLRPLCNLKHLHSLQFKGLLGANTLRTLPPTLTSLSVLATSLLSDVFEELKQPDCLPALSVFEIDTDGGSTALPALDSALAARPNLTVRPWDRLDPDDVWS